VALQAVCANRSERKIKVLYVLSTIPTAFFFHSDLVIQVEAAYRAHAVASGDADHMVAAGAVDAALSSLAASRNYDKLFEAASKSGSATLARYIFPYVADQLASGRPADAVAALAKYGSPASAAQVCPRGKQTQADLGHSLASLRYCC
jgi:hypothetical protein